eukprot:5420419-Pleurochrysis_carterae.AAC.1
MRAQLFNSDTEHSSYQQQYTVVVLPDGTRVSYHVPATSSRFPDATGTRNKIDFLQGRFATCALGAHQACQRGQRCGKPAAAGQRGQHVLLTEGAGSSFLDMLGTYENRLGGGARCFAVRGTSISGHVLKQLDRERSGPYACSLRLIQLRLGICRPIGRLTSSRSTSSAAKSQLCFFCYISLHRVPSCTRVSYYSHNIPTERTQKCSTFRSLIIALAAALSRVLRAKSGCAQSRVRCLRARNAS